jgi:hypothetical protein
VSQKEDDMATQVSSSRLDLHGLDTAITPNPHRLRTKTPTTGSPSLAPSSSTTIGSPLEALEHDEILRTRWFCLIGTAIAIVGGASAFLLPGDPTISALLLGAVSTSLVAIAFLYQRTRDPIAFRRPSTSLGWFVPAACVTAAIPYFGVFSPVAVVLVLGVYFTGLGKSWRLSFAVYAVCAGMQLLVAIMVIGGARDTGIVQPAVLSTRDQIIIQLLVQIVMLATIVTARMSRRTALKAVGELERAVRVAAHREALLLEAREELERALRQGRGRFSDQTIGGYHLGELLGRGAMGEVYEAHGPAGRVAIKLLSQASLSNPNHVLRFLRELRTAAAVRAPNIVNVIEVGEHPVPYLVMERLEGMTLGEMLRARTRPMSGSEVVDVVTHVGAGITAAAAAGIVHRDLKPQNVFRAETGTSQIIWKVLDFGVARLLEHTGTLSAGVVVGTPQYMAPEQARGDAVDGRADLYALALLTYRALTGRPPFVVADVRALLAIASVRMPPRPSVIAPIARELDEVLAVGMSKEPADRFPTAAAFHEALKAAAEGTLEREIRQRAQAVLKRWPWDDPTRGEEPRSGEQPL